MGILSRFIEKNESCMNFPCMHKKDACISGGVSQLGIIFGFSGQFGLRHQVAERMKIFSPE